MRRRHRWGRLVRGQTVRVLRTAIWAGLLGLLPGGPIGPWGGWSDVDCLPNSGFGLLRPVSAQEPATAHGIDAQQVRTAIDRAVRFVKSRQNQPAGNWSSETGYTGGVSALCTLALLNAGVPLDDPVVRRGLHYVRRPLQGRRTYTVSLQTMVLCTAEPEKDRLLIRENVQWLQRAQIRSGPNSGGWSYDESPVGGDPSNTQFAMLALFEAERIGMEVAPATWRQALGYWTRRQQPDGSWNYPDRSPSGSMTCAGVASVVIALGQLSAGDARVVDGQVECCGPQADNDVASRGLAWLGKHFSVSYNPGPRAQRNATFSQSWHLYYLYALERVGRMTGNRFIGDHDWYREGAEELINRQNAVEGFWQGVGIERNRDISTALGLLFLSKGRRPILMAKYDKDPQGDWNRHRSDIAHLTRIVEQGWKQDLTWQTVRGSAATLDDLLQAPVIYLCGRDSLQLTAAQKEVLRQYVEHGGFIFAESYCGGEGFDRDFRRFVADVFPESPLRLLPPDHPSGRSPRINYVHSMASRRVVARALFIVRASYLVIGSLPSLGGCRSCPLRFGGSARGRWPSVSTY